VFHGVGVPYLHYPFFKAFGGDLYASELARSLVPVALHVLSVGAFLWAWTRRPLATIWLTAVLLVYPAAVLTALYLPGNSSLGARSFSPILIAAVVVGARKRARRIALESVLLAIALSLGVEQGIAAGAAVVIAYVTASAKNFTARQSGVLIEGPVVVALGLLCWLCITLALAGVDGARAVARYQLKDLPGDQFWYFGVPPNHFIGRWSDLAGIWWVILSLVVACVMIVLLWRRKLFALDWQRAAGATMLLVSGALSCVSFLAISTPKYGAPLLRSVLVTGAALAYTGLLRSRESRLARGKSPSTGWVQKPAALLLRDAVCVACIGGGLLITASSAQSTWRALRTPRLSERLERDMSIADSVIGSVNARPDSVRIWSTYAGLLEARRGAFSPSADYIIHALGPGRERYLESFDAENPDIVQTVRPSQFNGYEEWLQTTTWPFYERLVERYTVAAMGSRTIFWKRRPAVTPSPSTQTVDGWSVDSSETELLVLSPRRSGHELPTPMNEMQLRRVEADGFHVLVVEVDYATKNPWIRFPLIGQTPRFFVRVDGARNRLPVTLPPKPGTIRFPVYLDSLQSRPTIRPQVVSLLPGPTLRFSRVRWRELVLPKADSVLVGS
jgi:hypothetical protein